jgi:putative polysaccharide biosynthesis protein
VKAKPASRYDRFLHQMELLAYDLAGLPMAVRALVAGPRPTTVTTSAQYLHTVYARLYWQKRNLLALLRTVLAILLFPLALPVSIAVYTRRNGRIIRERTGKPISRQIAEQAWLSVVHSIAPYWYYVFELHEDALRARAGLYLQRHETKGPAYGMLQPATDDGMQDKLVFSAACLAHAVCAAPVVLDVTGGVASEPGGGAPRLPARDIFVKPRVGRGGRHAERWDWSGGDAYTSVDGHVVTERALMARLERLSAERSYIVQPRLANHPDLADLNNGALATVRIVTIRDELGGFEATDAVFRMAIGRNRTVDNFHAGGIAAAVDIKTGALGLASNLGTDARIGWHATHPTSGARIEGRVLPFWPELVDLACRAHAVFPNRVIVGWDIAVLVDGPCVVEGNTRPDLDIHQRIGRGPLADGRLSDLLAWNVRRAIDARR